MDWAAVITSAAVAAVIHTAVIIILYQKWIIPHIINGVKNELMISIKGWVDELTTTLSSKISVEIDEKMLSLKRSIIGKRGNNSRLLTAAQSYLTENLSEDQDDPANDDIIAEAIGKYSKPIVDAVLAKVWPKKAEAAAAENDPAAAGWC